MRLLVTLAVSIALAWGVWTLLGTDDEPEATMPDIPTEPPPATPTANGTVRYGIPTTVTLVMLVKTEGGNVPQKTRAGYRAGGDDRLRTVDRDGKIMFTDVPTGPVTLLVRAPGYEDIEQKRYLTGGVRADAVLTLKPRQASKKP